MFRSNCYLVGVTMRDQPTSGRRAQAARNDELILESARDVYVDDPDAPISAVARRAGVGISALYRRFESKEDLLRRLCGDGLKRYLEEAELALADAADPWNSFTRFLENIVDADTASLTLRLAGTFTPTEDLVADALRSQELNIQLVERTKASGDLRADFDVNDLSLIIEQIAAIRVGDAERTRQLRRRYLALTLEALHGSGATPLPGPPPTWEELSERWDS
jgi:AcrR family transcriptional regulator